MSSCIYGKLLTNEEREEMGVEEETQQIYFAGDGSRNEGLYTSFWFAGPFCLYLVFKLKTFTERKEKMLEPNRVSNDYRHVL